MKKYAYVECFGYDTNQEHRKIIDDYANRGYKYVGYIPSSIPSVLSKQAESIDLIFEKDED